MTITDSGIIFSYRNRHLLSFASDSSGKWQLTMDAPIVSDASMSAPTITGGTITSAVYRTANGRLTINDAGIVLKNASGTSTLAADSATGSVTLVGTVKASQVTGSTITTTNGRMLWNDAGLVLKDANGSITLYASSMDGSVTMKGSLTSGRTLSGVTVTGSIIQTTGAANRGVKLTSGGLVGYDSSGNAKFALDTNGNLKMDGGILANGTLTAPTVNAGVMTSTVINAPVVQSSTADNTGWKLRGNALDMWDSKRNHTVHLDGEGRSNLLTGAFQTRVSGHRVRISPDYATGVVGGAEKSIGDGVEFVACDSSNSEYYRFPAIASAVQSNDVGEMSVLDFWSGHVKKNDPASFLRLGSKPRERGGTGSGGIASEVYAMADSNYDEPDESKTASASLNLSYDSVNGARVWLQARDANGRVGVGANIMTGYLYLGGFLGGIQNRSTFQSGAAWKAWWPNPGHSIPTGASVQITCRLSPTKYGRYYAVANADSEWAGIIAHPTGTGGQSGFNLKLFNADQPCPVEVYAEYLAYLAK